MLTVVLKLLQIVRPDRVFFGEKDYQQLVLIRQMVADLNVDVAVVGVPTVREADGLAMSSRNRYLDAAAARTGRRRFRRRCWPACTPRPTGAQAALDAARAVLDAVPAIAVDYLELRDAELGPVPGRLRRLAGCWLPPGWAAPDCWTTSRSKSEHLAGTRLRAGRAQPESHWRN